MLFVRGRDFREHTANDQAQFNTIISALKTHDINVDEKHVENRKAQQALSTEISGIKTQLDDILKLRPAIEAGIAADKDAEYRKKLFRRVFLAVVATATTVGGILPLIQWLASLRIHIGFV